VAKVAGGTARAILDLVNGPALKLADNIAGFVRVLRKRDFAWDRPIHWRRCAPQKQWMCCDASNSTGPCTPSWCGAGGPRLFDQAFGLFWRDPLAVDQALSLLLSHSRVPLPPGVAPP